jgi:ankyrin repeat protein
MSDLYHLCESGDVEGARAALARGEDPNATGGWDARTSCLMEAADGGHTGVVELLLAQPGIAVNAVNSDNLTALHSACWSGRPDIVMRLLAHPGVHVNTRTIDGWAPIMWAVRCNHVETVRVMAGDGRVELDTVDNDDRTLEDQAR